MVQQGWHIIVGMIQEMVEAKFEVTYPLDKSNDEILNRFGLHGLNSIELLVSEEVGRLK